MAFEVSVHDGVAEFVLDNPPQNRLNTETMLGCAAGVEQVNGDDTVRVVVIRATRLCFDDAREQQVELFGRDPRANRDRRDSLAMQPFREFTERRVLGIAVRPIDSHLPLGEHDDDFRKLLERVIQRAECDSFGGEIASWDMNDPDRMVSLFALGLQITNALEQLPMPVIAAVQGNCSGGGFEIALRADVIIAAESARFCHTEGAIGMFTLLGGVQRVAERAGRARAMRWALTSEKISAADALTAGVVSEVVPDDQLEAATAKWVARLARGATRAHAGHKALLNAWADGGVRAADALLPEVAAQVLRTADAKFGVAAAVEADAAGIARPDLDFAGH